MLNDERDISVIVREFHHRYHALAESAGYRLVFETFKLIQQYLPCREIGLDIGKVATDHPDDVFPVDFVITIATPIETQAADIFWRLMPYIPFAVRVAKRHKTPAVRRRTGGCVRF
ncbi:hypothetical protein [Methylocucumis oryzae]|uniref:Uncharacterized protein n=1 Tax=Methylocucumis oryzae TaxID=1632867 RepID=A0A0F3IJH7_9GAMM|nr:hypothetical protein [Methylocucumis oryzae]KJV06925.1 hypothetical protein VZ94_08170 [Methylocucumis oryzae]